MSTKFQNRPISVLNNMNKIFEKVIQKKTRIIQYRTCSFFPDCQHGFEKGKTNKTFGEKLFIDFSNTTCPQKTM